MEDRNVLFLVLFLYVGVAAFNSPQDGLESRLRFVTATFPSARYGVGIGLFSPHAQHASMLKPPLVWL